LTSLTVSASRREGIRLLDTVAQLHGAVLSGNAGAGLSIDSPSAAQIEDVAFSRNGIDLEPATTPVGVGTSFADLTADVPE
jgi:hypothetical protein